MSSLTGFVKRIRDIMWNDAGVNGDAQRIEQMAWILFLKVYNTKEEEWRYTDRPYTSIIPEECRWNNWAADDKSGKAMTGDTLLCVQRELRSIFGRKKKNLLNYQVESCRIAREDYRLFFEGCYPLPLQYLHGDDSVLILYR